MKVTTFLTDGFETVEALAVVDVLRRAKIDVELVSITGKLDVLSAQKITVMAEKLIEDADFSDSDVLFLPGGSGHRSYLPNEALVSTLKAHDEAGKRIAAICAAPSVLGKLGMLEGKKATVFPGFEDDLIGAEVLMAPVKVVTDGHITTSRGMGTSLDLGIELVKLLIDEDTATNIKDSIQYA